VIITWLCCSLTTGSITGSPFCVTASTGASVSVPYSFDCTFSGNTLTAQLSDASGSFASPVNIGTLTSDASSGSISATIPANTPTGTGYRIRVISSSPARTGSDNGTNLTVNLATSSIAPAGVQNINVNANGTALTVTEFPTAVSRTWYYGTVSGGPYPTSTGVTTTTYTPNFATQGTYYVVCISTFACGAITSNQVQVNVHPYINTGSISGSPFCVTASAGASVTVPFTSVGTFTSNTYTAQLSNASGSFASPVNIGSLVSDANSGNISATIPANTPTGTGYRIRVNSSSPAETGTDNGSNLTVNLAANSIAPTGVQDINIGANGTPLTVTEQSTPVSRAWYYGTASGGPYSNSLGNTTTTYTPNFATQGTYYVVCISTFDCGTITSNEVQVNVSATVTTGTISGSPFCVTATNSAPVSVPFTSAGTFTSNTYTAQLSNASGSFASPVSIGTLVSDANSGTIDATIPAGTAAGSGYRIRVVSSNPAVTGSNNGTNLTVTLSPVSAAGLTICTGGSGNLTASGTCSGSSTSSGPNDAGTGANVAIGSNADWSNPGNITTAGSPYATVTLAPGNESDYLRATNYNFSIPSDATITGIVVTINRTGQQSLSIGFRDDLLYLVKDVSGSPQIQTGGDNKASSSTWPTSLGTATYGNSGDLWGLSWTPSDINNTNFGVAISVHSNLILSTLTATVDYMRITVHYTVPGSYNWYTQSSGGTIVQTGTPFKPIGDTAVTAQGGIYASLGNSTTAGTYPCWVECSTGSTGCRVQADLVINQGPTGTITATENSGVASNDNTICAGSYVTFTATSGFSNYNFKVNSSSVQNGGSDTYLTNSLANGASVTVDIYDGSCTSTLGPVVITVNDYPGISVQPTSQPGCDAQYRYGSGSWNNCTGTFGETGFNSNTLVFTNLDGFLLNGIKLQCVVTTNGCATPSDEVTLTVNELLQYRSFQDGDWDDINTWEKYDGTGWYPASSWPGQVTNTCSGPSVVIRNGHEVTVDTDVDFDGDVTVENGGTLTMQGENKLTGTGTFTLSAGATLGIGSVNGITASAASGNIQMSSRNYSSGASYIYSGTSGQVQGDGLPSTLTNLTVDNPANLTMQANITVTGVLTLTNGHIIPGSWILFVSNSASGAVVGGSTSSYVRGTLRRAIAGGTNYNFPVGSNPYDHVEISFDGSSATGTLDVSTTTNDHPQIGSSYFNAGESVNRYWTMNVVSGLSPVLYDATFNWESGEEDTNFEYAKSHVGKYSGSAWSYPTMGARTATSAQITGQTSFSDFQVSEFNAVVVSITANDPRRQNLPTTDGLRSASTMPFQRP